MLVDGKDHDDNYNKNAKMARMENSIILSFDRSDAKSVVLKVNVDEELDFLLGIPPKKDRDKVNYLSALEKQLKNLRSELSCQMRNGKFKKIRLFKPEIIGFIYLIKQEHTRTS